MNFNFSKFKREKVLSPKSLKPKNFDVDFYWFVALGVCSLVFLAMAFVGAKLFYNQYFETYKENKLTVNIEELLNINQLKTAVEKRNELINKEFAPSRDPSL